MNDFMDQAKSTNKAGQTLSTGDLYLTLETAKAKLFKNHPVHLMNYSGGPIQIRDILGHFSMWFVGISSNSIDPDKILLNTIKDIPFLERMVVESNCPIRLLPTIPCQNPLM